MRRGDAPVLVVERAHCRVASSLTAAISSIALSAGNSGPGVHAAGVGVLLDPNRRPAGPVLMRDVGDADLLVVAHVELDVGVSRAVDLDRHRSPPCAFAPTVDQDESVMLGGRSAPMPSTVRPHARRNLWTTGRAAEPKSWIEHLFTRRPAG